MVRVRRVMAGRTCRCDGYGSELKLHLAGTSRAESVMSEQQTPPRFSGDRISDSDDINDLIECSTYWAESVERGGGTAHRWRASSRSLVPRGAHSQDIAAGLRIAESTSMPHFARSSVETSGRWHAGQVRAPSEAIPILWTARNARRLYVLHEPPSFRR